ncbi:MAG: NYN domain-containing protein [Dehalococcoidia bacterium]
MSAVAAQRTVVLIDAQNAYMGARRVFFASDYPAPARPPTHCGQFHPLALARLLVARTPGRILHEAHVYRGRPNRHIDPRGHAANVRQSVVWAASGVQVHPRQLRYLGQSPTPSDGEEKGVDVEIAVALTSMSLRGAIDAAIVVSADTDLLPAIEEVQLRSNVAVEVAGWHNSTWGERIRRDGHPSLWCHWLARSDYDAVCDVTDYNIR